MKYLLITLLLFSSLNGVTQTTVKFIPELIVGIYESSAGFGITDSSGTILATRDTSGKWKITDTTKALEAMYQHLRREQAIKEAIQNILSFITDEGKVIDRRKVKEGFKEYVRLLESNYPYLNHHF